MLGSYQQYVKDGMSPNYDLNLAVLGLVGEVGEVADAIKKNGIYKGTKDKMPLTDKLKDELGDVTWQLFALLNVVGLSMTEVMAHNVDKLNHRHGGAKLDEAGGVR